MTTQTVEKISHEIKSSAETRQADELRVLSLILIHASTFNPRKHFDQAALDELTESIRTHGVIEPLIVRPLPQPEWDGYEIIGGERRYRAAKAAGLHAVPCLIRAATDQEALELALVENLQRKDINAIEEAEGYKALAALGYKQKDIAAKVNRSQPAIANAMRLLDLPQSILDRVASGELSTSHAVALCRFKASKTVQEFLADKAITHKWRSRDLEEGMPANYELEQKGLIRSLRGAVFDTDEHCKKCPFGALVGTYCLRTDHYDDLTAIGEKEREIANQQLAEETRAKVASALEEAHKTESAAPTKAAKKDAAKIVESAQNALEAVKDSLPQISKMKYNAYHRIFESSCPATCTEHCPCRGKAVGHTGEIVDVCLSPTRYRSLEAQASKIKNKERKARVSEKLKAAQASLKKMDNKGCYSSLCAIVAQASLSGLKKDEIHEAAGMTQVQFKRPGLSPDKMQEIDQLSKHPIAQQIDFLVAAILRHEAAQACEYSESTPIADYICALLPSEMPLITEPVHAQPLCVDCDPAFTPPPGGGSERA